MLAQVLWRQIIYQSDYAGNRERGAIPQGTIVFVSKDDNTISHVIWNEMCLVVPSKALKTIESEDEIIPLEELQKKYHNKKNSTAVVE